MIGKKEYGQEQSWWDALMLEKTEGVMYNGQSRGTAHIRKSTQYNRTLAKKKYRKLKKL